MLEGHVVAGSPRELSAEASVDALLVVAIRRDVTDFLLAEHQGLRAGVELDELHHGNGGDIADVAHRLELVQVLRVVNEVEHEVVLHRHIEGLHLLGLSASSSADGALDGVLGLHESVVLGLDFVNNTWGVDGVAMAVPIDSLQLLSRLVLVVVVKESLQLSVSVASFFGCGSRSKSLEPNAGQVAAYQGRNESKRVQEREKAELITYLTWRPGCSY